MMLLTQTETDHAAFNAVRIVHSVYNAALVLSVQTTCTARSHAKGKQHGRIWNHQQHALRRTAVIAWILLSKSNATNTHARYT